jgi:hypothetical protein
MHGFGATNAKSDVQRQNPAGSMRLEVAGSPQGDFATTATPNRVGCRARPARLWPTAAPTPTPRMTDRPASSSFHLTARAVGRYWVGETQRVPAAAVIDSMGRQPAPAPAGYFSANFDER